jgi:integrase/recombinase XerC
MQAPGTREGYGRDLLAFGRISGVIAPAQHPPRTPERRAENAAALLAFGKWLFAATPLEGNAAAAAYVKTARDRGLSGSTIGRCIGAVKSLLSLGRALGQVNWTIELKRMRRKRVRDMRGPTKDEVVALLDFARRRTGIQAKRDYAMLLLLYVRGLRSHEVRELDLKHFDATRGLVHVRGKGDEDRVEVTIPPVIVAAIHGWLEIREPSAGPLFTSFDNRNRGGRLNRVSFWRIVTDIGKEAGIKVRPHGLRHAAITEGLDITNGDVRRVQKFSRHRTLQMLVEYDDARQDFGGDISKRIADELLKKEPKP